MQQRGVQIPLSPPQIQVIMDVMRSNPYGIHFFCFYPRFLCIFLTRAKENIRDFEVTKGSLNDMFLAIILRYRLFFSSERSSCSSNSLTYSSIHMIVPGPYQTENDPFALLTLFQHAFVNFIVSFLENIKYHLSNMRSF